jgi:oligosaccharyltransferase complex subunit beta
MEVAEWKGKEWVPFKANDIQMEAVMLDPYVRATLTPAPASAGSHAAKYSVHFQLPDQYGMFTFKTVYKRPGYTYLENKETLSVVPFRRT